MQKIKITILYGIGEGDYQGRALVSELKKRGFDVIRDEKDADILITHSAGCWFLPPTYKQQKLIFVGPPYWPDRSLAWSTLKKIMYDFWDLTRHRQFLTWIVKTLFNVLYILRYLILKMFTKRYKIHWQRYHDALSMNSTFIIRNTHDAFLTPSADLELHQKFGRTRPIIQLPGQHDSCLHDPAPYVALIRKVSRGVL